MVEEKEERQSLQEEPDETEKPGVEENAEKEQGETHCPEKLRLSHS